MNSGKVYLVTGAGAGIGRALVEYLSADPGSTVYAGVRDLRRAKSEYGNTSARIVYLDVNKEESIKKAVSSIEKKEGKIDVLINNAGYGLYGPFEEISDKNFRLQFETNFFSCLRLIRLILPGMRKHRQGMIVNVTSVLGRMVLPTGSAYSASKFALEGFSEALRYEVSPFGVNVVIVEPGLVKTNFKKNMDRKSVDASSPYAFFGRRMSNDYSSFTTSAESAARRIARISKKSYPGVRYRVGWDAHLYHFLLLFLPDRFVDLLFRFLVNRFHRAHEREIQSAVRAQ